MNNIKRKLNILKKRKIDKKLDSFFGWVKGAELVELKSCNITEDPVRPELDIIFRRSYGRKIFGVKYNKEICFPFKWKAEKLYRSDKIYDIFINILYNLFTINPLKFNLK